MKTVDHKCPSCNASINYNPKEKNWVCEYCGSVYVLRDYDWVLRIGFVNIVEVNSHLKN